MYFDMHVIEKLRQPKSYHTCVIIMYVLFFSDIMSERSNVSKKNEKALEGGGGKCV